MAQHIPDGRSSGSGSRKKKSVIKPPKKRSAQNLSRDEQRYIDNKKRNRKRKLIMNLVTLLIAGLVICVGIILVLSLFFKINTISVTDENIYTDKMVTEKCGIEIGSNLFRVNEEDVSAILAKELPYIKSATVERKLPDTIVIKVKSTKAVAAIPFNGSFILIDENAKVLDKDSSVLSENVPVISGIGLGAVNEGEGITLTSKTKTEALVPLLGAVQESKLELLTEINLKSVDDIKIIYDDRITFEVGNLTNIDAKLARGAAALEKENEMNAYARGTLDLKLEPYVYFKSAAEDKGKKENSKK